MINLISLHKSKMLLVAQRKQNTNELGLALNAEFMRLGFIMSKELFNAVSSQDVAILKKMHADVLPILSEMKGDHVKHNPMYKNFPQEVHDKSIYELYFNAVIHYWSSGEWMPDSKNMPRELAFESINYITINLGTTEDFMDIFYNIVGSNTSMSEFDKRVVKWFIEFADTFSLPTLNYPPMPFKENLCYVMGLLIENGMGTTGVCKTATDILRVIVALSGGDISLASNTRFKSLPRKLRKEFVIELERVINPEDIKRHQSKWVKLFHSLHIGEYSKIAPKTLDIANTIRNGGTLTTIQSMIEAILNPNALKEKKVKSTKISNKWLDKHFGPIDLVSDEFGETDIDEVKLLKLLATRPGEFARRIDQLIRYGVNVDLMIKYFTPVVSKVSTRVLLQLYGHFKNRNVDKEKRMIFPKGSIAKAIMIPSNEKFDTEIVAKVIDTIVLSLKERFATDSKLGKIYIDPDLIDCPIPMSQRSDSTGLFTVARGTRLPIFEDKNTLRFFVYWVGQDIDLSATLHNENFEMVDHISYTNLKSDKIQAYHSGDITSARHGASEFIDIRIDKFPENVRYIVMNLFVFTGPSFAEHSEAFAGYMTRENPGSNEIFDPKTVEYKVNLTLPTRNMIPFVFDIVERKAIFVDLPTKHNVVYNTGNSVESNVATIKDILKFVTSLSDKANLYELFTMHSVRGELVSDKSEADTIFSMSDGITPYDVDEISTNFMK